MAKSKKKVVSTNFGAGELDPKLVPIRSDVQAWQQGCAQLVNYRPLLHGGATTRPGTDYCASLGAEARLAPFEFSETQGYVLAIKNGSIDIYYDDGTFAVTVAGTPWTLAQAKELRIAQSGDTMILVHPDVSPRKLVRTAAAAFTQSAFAFDFDTAVANRKLCPFYRFAASSITLTFGAVAGAGVACAASSAVFSASHVGVWFRSGGKQFKVATYVNSTNVTVDIYEALPAVGPTTDWDEEAFNPVRGYPQAVAFHNERLVFGGAKSRPSGIWASRVGLFGNFDLGDAADDKAIWAGISADKVVQVLHLASFKHLSIFTDSVELYQPEDDTRPWSPKTTAFKPQSGFGCISTVAPARFDEAVVFIQRYGKQVREFLYDATAQTYSSDALSVMNPSRISGPLSIAAVTASSDCPEQYTYIVMSNGGVAVLHSLRAQRITAWAWWETDGTVLQVCAVNGKVFLLVQRDVGGTVYYLEKLNFDHALDCAKTVSVTVGGTTATGLAHLEGLEVQAVNSGYAFNPHVVSAGVYTLVDEIWQAEAGVSPPPPTATVGLPFDTTLECMPPEIQTDEGSSRGRPIRIARAGVQVYESVRLVVSGEGANITNIDDDYSVPPDPETGMYHFSGPLGFSVAPTVTISCDVPLPLTVLGLALEVVA